MLRKFVEVERRPTAGLSAGYMGYYLVTKWYFLGILIYRVEERKE